MKEKHIIASARRRNWIKNEKRRKAAKKQSRQEQTGYRAFTAGVVGHGRTQTDADNGYIEGRMAGIGKGMKCALPYLRVYPRFSVSKTGS